MRTLAAVMLVAIATSTASAGLKCKQLEPPVVFYDDRADVHPNGQWHRTKHGTEVGGHLTREAFQTFSVYINSVTDHDLIIRCLDALIADPNAAAAKRFCRA